MAPPRLNHSRRAQPKPTGIHADVECIKRMRDGIESMRHTMRGSHRTIEGARRAIGRADEIVARQLSERR